MIIAVLNSKGGVGKTTTAVNLAAALAGPRTRVLLVDLDSQASASLWCGVPRRSLLPSSASCLLDKYPILKAIRQTPIPQFDLLTGSVELANLDVALGTTPGREAVLARLLVQATGHYDLTLLDCPPGLSLLSINALIAADGVIVPVLPDPLGVPALAGVLAYLDVVRTRTRARTQLVGIVLTMVDHKRGHMSEVSEAIRTEHRDKVFRTEVRWSPSLARAPWSGKTTAHTRSGAGDTFRRLAAELLQRLSGMSPVARPH